MEQKFWIYTKEILKTFTIKVLLIDLVIVALVLLSFLIFGPFTMTALSERLFMVGLGVMLVGGVLALGQTTGGKNFGSQVFSTQQAELLTDFNIEVYQKVEKRFSPIMRIFLIGTVLFVLGIFVQVFLA